MSNDCSLAPLRPGRLPSQSRTDFPADSDEGWSSKICYSWNDGWCAIGPFAVIVPSVDLVYTKQCIAQPTPPPPNP